MKLARRTLFVAGLLGLGTCVLLPSISNSQIIKPRIKARDGQRSTVPIPSPLKDNAVGNVVSGRVPKVVPDEIDKVNGRISEIEDKIAAQQKALEAQQKVIEKQQTTIDGMIKAMKAKPQGYSKAFITIGNFHRLPATDAISYWARN